MIDRNCSALPFSAVQQPQTPGGFPGGSPLSAGWPHSGMTGKPHARPWPRTGVGAGVAVAVAVGTATTGVVAESLKILYLGSGRILREESPSDLRQVLEAAWLSDRVARISYRTESEETRILSLTVP